MVADVLVSILKENNRPMFRDDLVKEVLKRRVVKKNTIHLALTDKNKFKKSENGEYTLCEPST
ncbi:MAG: hypothetical protein ACD_12C00255G0002 [uncultured bacterium]|nr:MAG: hypothetical protein ACD_12C00255G0002 [uncultured bacterium]